MFSHLSHSWPLIPINMAIHHFLLVDTPEHAGYPYFYDGQNMAYDFSDGQNMANDVSDGHTTAWDYVKDVVGDSGLLHLRKMSYEHLVVSLLAARLLWVLLRFLDPVFESFFLRCLRSVSGFWYWLTSWPCLAAPLLSVPNSALPTPQSGLPQGESMAWASWPGYGRAQWERNHTYVVTKLLEHQLQLSEERNRKLRGGANDLVSEFNVLAREYDRLRWRSYRQTKLAKMLGPMLDWEKVGLLKQDQQRSIREQVREYFGDDKLGVPWRRASYWKREP